MKFPDDYPTKNQWKRIGTTPRHGIGLPLSALHTGKSCGIGEFFDLIPLIDWCHELGMSVIQLLPLNDSGLDPSPYNALSSCALNPIFLSLHALSPLPPTIPPLPYSKVYALKLEWLRSYYEREGFHLTQTPEFTTFFAEKSWVAPYALFKVLQEKFRFKEWRRWPAEMKAPNLSSLLSIHRKETLFFALLQYLCHLQLTSVKRHAHAKGVLLQGDIPILISPESVDTWSLPHLFDFSFSAGAPPDAYNPEGQSWGFPLFNWEEMRRENFSWWKQRLLAASAYYDLYRIDHVVGFFRIWALSQEGGKFTPSNPALWIPQGKEILQMMIESCPMLPIGEDLGVIPSGVRQCLTELGICGTKVIRWERHYEGDGSPIPFNDYPLLSLTSLSTHDSETLELWWKNNPAEATLFASLKGWNYSPSLSFQQRFSLLFDSHHTSSLFHINLLQEYLALFPELVSPNPADERINVPGKVLPSNWAYRFRTDVETITSHLPLKEAIFRLL